jgi:hypothetical protein
MNYGQPFLTTPQKLRQTWWQRLLRRPARYASALDLQREHLAALRQIMEHKYGKH